MTSSLGVPRAPAAAETLTSLVGSGGAVPGWSRDMGGVPGYQASTCHQSSNFQSINQFIQPTVQNNINGIISHENLSLLTVSCTQGPTTERDPVRYQTYVSWIPPVLSKNPAPGAPQTVFTPTYTHLPPFTANNPLSRPLYTVIGPLYSRGPPRGGFGVACACCVWLDTVSK